MPAVEPHDLPPSPRLPPARAADADYVALMSKAEVCAAALVEARRLSGAALLGSLYVQLEHRTRDMLDELDDALLLLDLQAHRDAYERVAALHAGFEELQYRRDHLGV